MVEISIERYAQLVRAEQVAEQLVELIKEKHQHYSNIERAEINMLHQLFCAGEEE